MDNHINNNLVLNKVFLLKFLIYLLIVQYNFHYFYLINLNLEFDDLHLKDLFQEKKFDFLNFEFLYLIHYFYLNYLVNYLKDLYLMI